MTLIGNVITFLTFFGGMVMGAIARIREKGEAMIVCKGYQHNYRIDRHRDFEMPWSKVCVAAGSFLWRTKSRESKTTTLISRFGTRKTREAKEIATGSFSNVFQHLAYFR